MGNKTNELEAINSASVDLETEDYVAHILKTQPALPPFRWTNLHNEIYWSRFFFLVIIPIMGMISAYYIELRWETFVFSCVYAVLTGMAVTAGYHRLWSHRSYTASKPLQYVLALFGAASLQGSILWWSRTHRSHHRYVDTDLDPTCAHQGLFHTHIGWLILRPRRKYGLADISDLKKNDIVLWQQRNYIPLAVLTGFVIPTVVPWLLWNDAKGGYLYAGVVRYFIVQQLVFCVNSIAHWMGYRPYDDNLTARDHFFTAIYTIGEGYHNTHHQFPMDYRSGVKWYDIDPAKWFIWTMKQLGLASHLKMFPENEIRKGKLAMQLKQLRAVQETLVWPTDSKDLPVITWDSFQEESQVRPLVLISGFIHDVKGFVDEHPGGPHLLNKMIGKDATTAFFGGVYDHSDAAQNLLAMKRVGILLGGHPHVREEKAIPPSQKLKIARYDELWSASRPDLAPSADEVTAD